MYISLPLTSLFAQPMPAQAPTRLPSPSEVLDMQRWADVRFGAEAPPPVAGELRLVSGHDAMQVNHHRNEALEVGGSVFDKGLYVHAYYGTSRPLISAQNGHLLWRARPLVTGAARYPKEGWNMENTWVFLADGERREYHVTHWLYSGHELDMMLRQAGFATAALYGGFDGTPYGLGAVRLVAVARKG